MGWIARGIAVLLTVLVLLGVALGLVGLARGATDPLYTPAQFAALHLRHHLRIGQTLRLTGALRSWWPAGGVIWQQPEVGPRVGVVVIFGSGNSAVTWLRSLPLVGALIPPTADHPLLNRTATFRVRAVPCRNDLPFCPWRSPALQLQDGGGP